MAPWYNIDHSYNGIDGGGATVCDWNGDGWDDIALASNGVCKFYQNTGEGFVSIAPFFSESYHVKQISFADFDNDNDLDMFISCYLQPFRLFENIGDAHLPEFVEISVQAGLPVTFVRNYGHAWSDFDSDGWLDLYVSTYAVSQDAKNFMFKNNGNGTFTEMAVALGIDDGFAMTMQPVFCDVNNDCRPDLFLANDKLFPNKLYLNIGGTSFIDISIQSGLNVVIDAMSATAGDFDNDGWDDIYSTNNQNGNKLHKNNGNLTFTDVTQPAGVSANVFCWGAQWIDGDNDGLRDLFVASDLTGIPGEDYRNKYFKNNGDGSFENMLSMPFTTAQFRSFSPAIGDFNDDGYADILLNNFAPTQSQLWLNQNTGNHFVKVRLEGNLSNVDAIGSIVTVQSDDLVLNHFTKCGEAYLAQNSKTVIFGLGANDTIQSIHVKWPSGLSETFYNLKVDTTYFFKEGQSLEPIISHHFTTTECQPQGSVFLTTDFEGPVLWNNGILTDTLTINQAGWYSASAEVFPGLILLTDSVFIPFQPDFEVVVSHSDPLCHGEFGGEAQVIIAEAIEGITIEWSTGENTEAIEGLAAGVYSVVATSDSGCQKSHAFELMDPEPLVIIPQVDNAPDSESLGQVKLNISGGTGPYTVYWSGGASNETTASYAPGSYGVWVSDANECSLFVTFEIGTNVDVSEFEVCSWGGIRVTENPCKKCQFEFCQTSGSFSINISEISGRLIESFNLSNTEIRPKFEQIFGSLSGSVYLVNYQSLNYNQTIKVIKTP